MTTGHTEHDRRSFAFTPRPGSGPQLEPDPSDEATVEYLPADAVVDLSTARQEAGIDDVLSTLDTELVGLAPVKTRIAEIAALLLVDRMRARFGITAQQPTLHMSFTGNPGTGKTTVALRMAGLLHRLGYLRRGHLVGVTRDDLVGEYVGHTAPKTRDVIKRAMGGVLFIDEAYYLYKVENDRDYGSESIEILLQVMENNRDDLVVILAGYADKMDTFFAANPGMQSRIAHHITFPDYTVVELEQIADLMTEDLGYQFSTDAREALHDYLERRVGQPWFANARSVRNAVERARLRQAKRLLEAEDPRVDLKTLMTIEPADILSSRVFSEEAGAGKTVRSA
ncbi:MULTISPECIES: CbbX protein [Pseudonocardia]|uniref:Stage V sporulation protein K n=2 Tax=Pseudonocardia TaxID=1847 RepID=A0A1Y2MH82_PSEAH|nr:MULTISPECIES: CbbX protein [Pseudonocardia]OSY34643.1 Stage V sporulation protein K [Pseudonocardia autotrophica]TDN76423.1 putative Rubsico expression protein CbbX [Pseudonocardia autotrophica]BBG00417.1 CbbX protein [Pseudonocardia autotrophica]GEC29505.1 CbbX protein [Pseudonocardia saturnea]